MATEELASPTPAVADPLAIPPEAVTDPVRVIQSLRIRGERARQLTQHYCNILANQYEATGQWLTKEKRSSAAVFLIQYNCFDDTLKYRSDIRNRLEELLNLNRLCQLSYNRIWTHDYNSWEPPTQEIGDFLIGFEKFVEKVWVQPAEDPLNTEVGIIFRPLVWDNGSGLRTLIPRFVFRFFPFRIPPADRILWEPDYLPHLNAAQILRSEEPRTPTLVLNHVIHAMIEPAWVLLRLVIRDILISRNLCRDRESSSRKSEN